MNELFEINRHTLDIGRKLVAVNHNDFKARHVVQFDFTIAVSNARMEFNFVDCLRGQIYDIDVAVWNPPFGSNVVTQLCQRMEHNSLRNEMLQTFVLELSQDILLFHSSIPPKAFPLQLDGGNAEKPSNSSHTSTSYPTPGCEAAQQRERLKMAGERCFSEPAFMPFSRAAVSSHTSTLHTHTSSSPSYYYDLSDEVHACWKETVSGHSAVRYWTNAPTTPMTMAGSVNNYLGMLPDEAFKDNAELRLIGLQSRAAIVGQQLDEGDWQNAMANLQYRLDAKVERSSEGWIDDDTARNVILNKNSRLLVKAIELQPEHTPSSWGGIIKPNQWRCAYSKNSILTASIEPDTVSGGVKFSFTTITPGYHYIEFWGPISENNQVKINHCSYINSEAWRPSWQSNVIVRIEVKIIMNGVAKWGSYDISQNTESNHAKTQTNLFILCGVSPAINTEALLVGVYVVLIVNGAGAVSGYQGNIANLYIGWCGYKDDIATDKTSGTMISTWSYNSYPGINYDGDSGVFETQSNNNMYSWFNSNVNSYSITADDSTYLYFKAFTTMINVPSSFGAFISICYKAKLSTGKWTTDTPAYKIQIDGRLWRIYTSSTDVSGENDLYHVFKKAYPLGNEYKVTGIRLDMTVPITGFTAKQRTYLDYIYITKDLDNDGILDEAGKEGGDNGDIDGDGMTNKYEWEYGDFNKLGVAIPYKGVGSKGGWQDPYEYNARYAVLVCGGGTSGTDSKTDGNYDAFWNDATALYSKLSDYGYLPENIYLMSSFWRDTDHTTDARVRGRCTWENNGDFGIDNALETIGNIITPNDFFFFCEVCHGPDPSFNADAPMGRFFWVHNTAIQDTSIASDFDIHFGGKINPKKYARMCIVLQSCCSGRMLDELEGKERIIITATQRNELSWCTVGLGITGTNDDHWAFLYRGIITNLILWIPYIEYQHDGFTTTLGSKSTPNTIKSAFDNGNLAASNNGVKMYSQWKDKLTSTPILWEYYSQMASKTYL